MEIRTQAVTNERMKRKKPKRQKVKVELRRIVTNKDQVKTEK